MGKQDIVKEILQNYDCQTAKQIAALCKRLYNLDITSSGVGSILRRLTEKGIVGSSNCGYGSTVYWINNGG